MRGLDKKVALVTGAASGIGLAIARRLQEEGMTVIGVDRNESAELGEIKIFLKEDLTSVGAAQRIIDHCLKSAGQLDCVINCAGIGRGRPLHDTSGEDWKAFLDVNLTTVYELSKAALEPLKKSKGAIVNITSVFAIVGFPNGAGYAASKAALIGLTRQMAADYGRDGIRVNAIAPGVIETPLTAARLEPGQWHRRATVDTTPLGRPGQPDEIASSVAFLCSSDASYIHGEVLVVDGGWSATRYYPPNPSA